MLGGKPLDVGLALPPSKRAKRKGGPGQEYGGRAGASTGSSSGQRGAAVDPTRIEAYLQAACSALNFDIGEIWCCNDGGAQGLHFVQLYTSPAYGVYRSKLVTPSDDWENHHDVSKHRFSPQICEAVRDGGQIVWANTGTEEGLLGRSDLPLRTAVGAPVCCVGYDLCILVLFSPCVLTSSPDAMEFLYTLAQAASEVMCGFLPASASEPVLPASADAHALSDHRKSQAIIDSLSQKSIKLQAWALGQIPSLAHHLRQAALAGDSHGLGLGLGLGLSPNRNSFSNLNLLHGGGLASSMSLPTSRPSTPLTLSADLFETLLSMNGQGTPASPISSALALLERSATFGPEVGAAQQQPQAAAAAAGGDAFSVGGGLNIEEDDDFLIWSAIMDAVAPMDAPATPSSDAPLVQAQLALPAPADAAPAPKQASGTAEHTGMGTVACNPQNPQCLPQQPAASSSTCFFEDPVRRSRFEEFIRGLLGMSVFHAADCWLPSADEQLFLACSSVQSPDLSKWTSFSSAVVFPAGVAPPGRIYQERVPMWFAEYCQVDTSLNPLAPIADILGIHTAFGVPIPVGGGKTGVVMFYSTSQLPTSGLMLSFVQRAFLVLLGAAPLPLPPSTSATTTSAAAAAAADAVVLPLVPMLPAPEPASCSVEASAVAAPAPTSSQAAPFSAGITPGAASSLGRVAGAYDRHAQWLQMQQQQAQQQLPQQQQPSLVVNTTGGSFGEAPAVVGGTSLQVPTSAVTAATAGSAAGAVVLVRPPNSADATRTMQQEQMQQTAIHNRLAHLRNHGLTALHVQTAKPMQVASFEVTSQPGGLVKAEVPFGVDETTNMAVGTVSASSSYGDLNTLGSSAAQQAQSEAAAAATAGSAGAAQQQLSPTAAGRKRSLCVQHSASKQCSRPGCNKSAQGSTQFCIGHGGGRRCTFPGCTKGARDRFFCAAHGGGKRCSMDGCGKAAVGGSHLCTAHGGGKRCNVPGCTKSAQSSTPFCVKHGGGRLCEKEGCEKVARGRTRFCAAHGGGIRCRMEHCNRAAVGKVQLCRMHTQQLQVTEAEANMSTFSAPVGGLQP